MIKMRRGIFLKIEIFSALFRFFLLYLCIDKRSLHATYKLILACRLNVIMKRQNGYCIQPFFCGNLFFAVGRFVLNRGLIFFAAEEPRLLESFYFAL